jgi:hypothetical protein
MPNAMKMIQDRARELKKKDPELKHKAAVKLASQQLRAEGKFKGPAKKKKKPVKRRPDSDFKINPGVSSISPVGTVSIQNKRRARRAKPKGGMLISVADITSLPGMQKLKNKSFKKRK